MVVVPGIMGSTLESADGRTLWGADKLGWYVDAWTSRGHTPLDELAVTKDELERLTATDGKLGERARIQAVSLLTTPAWAPCFQGLEPYTRLVQAIQKKSVDPAAVLPFPYDWRLPVAFNAVRLRKCAEAHLDTWRRHPAYRAHADRFPGTRQPRLVVVAHSMGGLLARGLGEHVDVRAIVTLGTPFDGAAKAAMILNTGRVPIHGLLPLPALPPARLQTLARTLPGLHDLLPTYRCLYDPASDTDPVRLTPTDVENLGGNGDLARESFEWHRTAASLTLGDHHALIGTEQPTVTTFEVRNGLARPLNYSFAPTPTGLSRDKHGKLIRDHDQKGDSTVPRNSAEPPNGHRPVTLAQQHGPIARSSESIRMVVDVLLERDKHAPRMGAGEIGIAVPDIISAGVESHMTVYGVTPGRATVTIHDAAGRQVNKLPIRRHEDECRSVIELRRPGIYHVQVEAGGTSAVSQRFLVAPA